VSQLSVVTEAELQRQLALPEHWHERKLKYIAAVQSSNVDKKTEEGEEAVRLCNYVDVYYNDRITSDLPFMEATATAAEIRKFALRAGDVIVTKDSESPEDIAVPAYVGEDLDGVLCGYHLALLRPAQDVMDGRFLYYCLASRDLNRQFRVAANGITRFGLSLGALGGARFPVPPLEKQRAVAGYLDEKTAAIDALIGKRERHIELLEEKRQAVLVDRVTRGLNPTTPMRESGVNWLGVVPAHWKVAPTRFVARLETGHTPSRQHPEYWVPEECTVPWFTLADVWQIREGRQEYLGDTAEKVSPLGLANSAARLLPAETVVLSRTASVGFSGIMPVPMATSQDFVNWVCGPEILPVYLLYVFRAMRQEFRRLTMGSTHQTIYMPDVRDFRTPLPPLEEQDAIVTAVRAEMARHDGLVARLREQIQKLREYRQTLISAAVIGQIPVREEVPA
jgi:type I restriction enzyme S subunit